MFCTRQSQRGGGTQKAVWKIIKIFQVDIEKDNNCELFIQVFLWLINEKP